MFTVIRDTREKTDKGWTFEETNVCKGTVIEKLDTGDYSLVGQENKVCVERKGSVAEWAGNLLEDRFYRELERMKDIEHKYIVLEFTLGELVRYPEGMPASAKKSIKVNGQFLLRKTLELELEYGVRVVFAGASGKEYILSLFKRLNEKNT